jgi:hypothetical protein
MPPSAFSDLFTYLTQLMTTNAPIFEAIGNRLYAAFTVILVVWFGIQCALKGGVPMDRFADLMLTISFGFAMTRFYSAPIPGFGVSFYHLIVDQGTQLANQLNASMVSNITERLSSLYWSMETPGLSALINAIEVIRWAVTILALVAALAAVYLVISFGYIASAICVLVGPIFIPFFVVPKMEWMFWGWLRALLQYSFYPVVANAYIYVFGSVLINFVDKAGNDFSGAKIAVLFVPLLFLLIAFTWGLLKIPSLVNSLFTGKSGESAMPF